MAFDPPLLGHQGIPTGIPGEFFCLQRGGISFELECPGQRTFKAKAAMLYLTTMRICIVNLDRMPTFTAFDIPLQGITGEVFKQPIFGANYLQGEVLAVPNHGMLVPRGNFKVSFYEGGCQTFLRVFIGLMERYRGPQPARQAWVSNPASIASFISESSAFVDPSDPTKLYLSQPEPPAPAGGRGTPYVPAYAPTFAAPVAPPPAPMPSPPPPGPMMAPGPYGMAPPPGPMMAPGPYPGGPGPYPGGPGPYPGGPGPYPGGPPPPAAGGYPPAPYPGGPPPPAAGGYPPAAYPPAPYPPAAAYPPPGAYYGPPK